MTILYRSATVGLLLVLLLLTADSSAAAATNKGSATHFTLARNSPLINVPSGNNKHLTLPRGGALPTTTNKRQATRQRSASTTKLVAQQQRATTARPKQVTAVASAALAITAATALLYSQREIWMPFLDRNRIQAKTLSLLRTLQPGDTNKVSVQSLAYYAAGMAVWEFFGLTTIPVETAAGMVFGWKGAAASGAGKLTGACAAFLVGRLFLTQVRERLLANGDSKWSVLWASETSSHSPLATAFLMKFSCFPEAVKNFGSSLLGVAPWMFVLATVLHGFVFTALWTWLGIDAAARLETDLLPANIALSAVLVLAGIVGVVVSPSLMVWWLRDLKRQADKKGKR